MIRFSVMRYQRRIFLTEYLLRVMWEAYFYRSSKDVDIYTIVEDMDRAEKFHIGNSVTWLKDRDFGCWPWDVGI
jgi:hypothetical protein